LNEINTILSECNSYCTEIWVNRSLSVMEDAENAGLMCLNLQSSVIYYIGFYQFVIVVEHLSDW
jgi:hypothetical protein